MCSCSGYGVDRLEAVTGMPGDEVAGGPVDPLAARSVPILTMDQSSSQAAGLHPLPEADRACQTTEARPSPFDQRRQNADSRLGGRRSSLAIRSCAGFLTKARTSTSSRRSGRSRVWKLGEAELGAKSPPEQIIVAEADVHTQHPLSPAQAPLHAARRRIHRVHGRNSRSGKHFARLRCSISHGVPCGSD